MAQFVRIDTYVCDMMYISIKGQISVGTQERHSMANFFVVSHFFQNSTKYRFVN